MMIIENEKGDHMKLRLDRIIAFVFTLVLLTACSKLNKLHWEENLMTGLQKSAASGKPVFLYFTCYACVGYDEFFWDFIEERAVVEELSDNYITVILFVDDQGAMQVTDTLGLSSLGGSEEEEEEERVRKAKDKGHLYATFQQAKFGQNSQPMYVVVDSDLSIQVPPFNYCKRDVGVFLERLRNE